MGLIYSNRGHEIIVDDDLIDDLSQWSWRVLKNGYAVRTIYKRSTKGKVSCEYMHRRILNLSFGDKVKTDHINHNKLDNRRSNLRKCTTTQNAMNSKVRKHNKTGYKGVYKNKNGLRFCASIVLNGKQKFLGTFDTVELAFKAYCDAAKIHFGNFFHGG